MSGWSGDDEREDHYLHIEAELVATEAMRETERNVAKILDRGGMMCVHGASGYGKTFAVNATLRTLPVEVCRVNFRSRPSPARIRKSLHESLGFLSSPPKDSYDFDISLIKKLRERRRVLVADEAQWMGKECFEYWRYLWDETRQTKNVIIFVGGASCYRVLRSEPQLSNRVYTWQKFTRLRPEEVQDYIPVWHPLWKGADPELIAYTDATACHGNFRKWAHVTLKAVEALEDLGRDRLDKEVVDEAFASMAPADTDQEPL